MLMSFKFNGSSSISVSEIVRGGSQGLMHVRRWCCMPINPPPVTRETTTRDLRLVFHNS
jgi:hypothetical protein